MRILMIPSYYETGDNSTVGLSFKGKVEALASSGIDVVVAYPEIRRFRLGLLRRGIYRDYSVEVPTYIYRKRTFTPFAKRGYEPQREKMLEALYERICRDIGQPDIVHLFSFPMGAETVALCKKHNLPLVYTEDYAGVLEKMNDEDKNMFERTLEGCDCPVAVSEDVKARMVVKRPDTLFIPNLVDTESFKILPSVEMSGAFVFAALGSLVPSKGYDILIRAFSEALRHMPGAKLYIAGSGTQEQQLKELIAELKVENSVFLVGLITQSLAPKFYNGCDCFVSASYSEAFAETIIEALSCGKPVISTRCGGPENIINKKNGLLVNAGDILSLERALIFMYRRAKSYNPFKLREECMKHFGKNFICQRLVQLYAHILNTRQRGVTE